MHPMSAQIPSPAAPAGLDPRVLAMLQQRLSRMQFQGPVQGGGQGMQFTQPYFPGKPVAGAQPPMMGTQPYFPQPNQPPMMATRPYFPAQPGGLLSVGG